MAKMIVSIDGVVIKEAELTQERTTLGRRPYNDIVIDNLAVSGEHAAVRLDPASGTVEVEDLRSTNGTYVNGKAIQRQALRNGDTIEIGKYKVRFLSEEEGQSFEKTMLFKSGTALPPIPPRPTATVAGTPVSVAAPVRPATAVPAPAAAPMAAIRVLSGVAAGREVLLTKVVTTIGKPGLAVAAITRRHHGFVLAHVEGPEMPMLNGIAIGLDPVPLKNGDHLELAGTAMQFVQG
ncbi:FHA domain-containing protein [Simplicispira psychrophila]|uniref:FHA domain-containing protein n=1 Tax=Simplicispira psychrophila TaxID=80882 RepID=UPI0004809996|nr:FHA domain-containing protein [Simplicispira psychrophila]